jgi:hypothetical protein
MSKNTINISLTDEDFSTVISALLFSCSVNVVSNTSQEYQQKLFDLAKRLKAYKPDVKITDIQFLKEENYEDITTEEVLKEFETNLDVITFENI